MATFKFFLDKNVAHLVDLFPSGQVETHKSLGLDPAMNDPQIIELANENGYVLVTNNRVDFERPINDYISQPSTKDGDCFRIDGLILLLPNEEAVQRSALKAAKAKLIYKGRKIGFKDIHDAALKVTIESGGNVRIDQLPRCKHCRHYKDVD